MTARLFALVPLLLLASSAAAQSAGDYDGDGDVDGDDFWYWAACMTGPAGSLPDPNCAAFDFDLSRADGKVDHADLAAFGRAFTGSPCTFGKKYANVTKSASATGCYAKIRTRWVTLCGEPTSKALAASAAWAGVTKFEGGRADIWAQTGYTWNRVSGSTTVNLNTYAETKYGPGPLDRDLHKGDSPGSGVHEYRCRLISSLFGTWEFEFDGLVWYYFTHDAWKGQTGTHYQYTAEIFNKEDQMVGVQAQKCDFTQCQYATNWGSFQDADITADSTHTDDPNEWGIERTSPTSFNVWDKKP